MKITRRTLLKQGALSVAALRAARAMANAARPYTAEDIRFTTKGETLYAFALAWPEGETLTIKTLIRGRKEFPRAVSSVELLGNEGRLEFVHNESGLHIKLPKSRPNSLAYTFRIL